MKTRLALLGMLICGVVIRSAILALCLSACAFGDFTIPDNDANLYLLGNWFGHSMFAGQTINSITGDTTGLAVSCPTTTGVAVQTYDAQPFTVVVDPLTTSNTPVTYTGSASGTLHFVNGPTGLSSGTHLFLIQSVVGNQFYIQANAAVKCIGTGVATVATAVMSGTSYQMNNGTLTASTTFDAGEFLGTLANYTNTAIWKTSNGQMRFNANITALGFWATGVKSSYLLYRNGVLVCTATPYVNATTTVQTHNFVSCPGLTSGAATYTLIENNTNSDANYSGAGAFDVYTLYLTGTGFTGSAPAVIPYTAGCGDSIEDGGSVISLMTVFDSTKVYTHLGSNPLGAADQHSGTGGARVDGTLDTTCATSLTYGAQTPSVTHFEGGVNDMLSGTIMPSDLTTHYVTMLNNALATNRATQAYLAFNIFRTLTVSAATMIPWRAAVCAAVTAYNAQIPTPSIPAICIDVDQWEDGFSDTVQDLLHPNSDPLIAPTTDNTTSVTIASGSVTFHGQPCTGPGSYTVGANVVARVTASPNTNYEGGEITGCSGTDLTVNMLSAVGWSGGGPGPYTGWTIWQGAGYAKMGNRLLPIHEGYLTGASYTISGPTLGTCCGASTPFTITYPGSGFFACKNDGTNDASFTLTDYSAGGTFTPSTLTPTCGTGTHTATFTYTPPGAGGYSLRIVSNQTGWKDVPDQFYSTVSGVTAQGVTLSGVTIQ